MQPISFEVLVDVWPTPEIKGAYTGLEVEAEKEEYEEDLVSNAINVSPPLLAHARLLALRLCEYS